MAKERLLIYQPQDVDKYAKPDGIEQFLTRVADTRMPDLNLQFRWFAYLRPSEDSNPWHYAGLMYLRDLHNKVDPLARIDGKTMTEGFNQMADSIGARVLSAEFTHGRMEIEAHVQEDYERVLGWALVPNHRDCKLKKPKEIIRFIFNLVPDARDRIIAPFLESIGYKGIFEFVTLEEPQSPSIKDVV